MRFCQFSGKGFRINNEDCCNVTEISDKRTLFVVCDGMGGHSFGEVASQTVCDSFTKYWQANPDVPDSVQKIMEAAKSASKALDDKSNHYLMGTTLVMCSLERGLATIAHAGDSRCYVIDIKGNVKYRTIDHIEHSPIGLPYINKSFFTHHPDKAAPDVKTLQIQPHDRILLCTDGLYNTIDDEALLHILQCAKDVEQVAEKYQVICKENAGDNYTAIIIEME